MFINLWCASDQELFSQIVHILLAQLENSLWSVKKDNIFNCLLIIASFSSLSKIFDYAPWALSFVRQQILSGRIHSSCSIGELYGWAHYFTPCFVPSVLGCLRGLQWLQCHRAEWGNIGKLGTNFFLFSPPAHALGMWIIWTLCWRKETGGNWKWDEIQHEFAQSRSCLINIVPFLYKIADLYRQGICNLH